MSEAVKTAEEESSSSKVSSFDICAFYKNMYLNFSAVCQFCNSNELTL